MKNEENEEMKTIKETFNNDKKQLTITKNNKKQ